MALQTRLRTLLSCLLCFIAPVWAASHNPHSVRLPLTFEPNKGQVDHRARFLARSGHGTVLLTDDGVVLTAFGKTSIQSVQMRLLHAVLPVVAGGESPTGGFVNYYKSKDSKQWLSHIPMYSQVRYSGIYPGIDVIFHGHEDLLEYDFEASAGSAPENISFSFEGADRIAVALDGGLEISSGAETWRLLAPVAYQMRGNVREPVEAGYQILADNSVGLRLGKFDRTASLIIDPVVQYGNIFSDNGSTEVKDVKVDAAGDLFIAGDTHASDYPVVNGKSPNGNSSQQVYLTKLNPAGDTILFSTFIPTSHDSDTFALALDGSGNAYIVGDTSDPNFPVTSTSLGSCSQNCEAGFLAKFAPDGSVIYSTLLASGIVVAKHIVVDSSGNAYLAGRADATLPTVNAFQASGAGVFFAKVDAAGQNYLMASYFSQPGHTGGEITGLTLDGSGNLFIAGQQADGVPLVNAWEFSGNGLFLAKFAPDLKTLLFSTTFGSGGADTLSGLAVGSDGTVYIVGDAASAAYPFTLNAAAHPVLEDGSLMMFATAVDPTLTKLTYSTYLGTGTGGPPAMALDTANHLHVAGGSIFNLLPLQGAVVSDITSGGFALELDPSGTPVFVSQFGGHVSSQIPTAIAVDSSNNTYVAGPYSPQNAFFPNQSDMIVIGTPMGQNTSFNNGSFFAKITPENSPQLSVSTGPPFLVVRNAGSADLHIASISLGGRLTKQFGNCGQTVPAGTSCVVTVLDSLNRIASGTVTISSDAQPAVQVFTINSPYTDAHPGPVIGDQVLFQDVRFAYPPQLTGSTTGSIPMTVWNVGTQNANINSITAAGSAFQTNNCNTQSGGTLVPGGNCTVNVSVIPGGSQPQLHFVYDTNSHVDIFSFFVATTQQSAVTAPLGIDFGIHHVNGISIPRTVTVTNTGGATISVQWSLQGDPSFVFAGNTCLSGFLDPHQSCVIGIQFNPSTNGRVSADLTVAGQQVQLFGTGEIPSVVQVSSLELDYFSTIVGTTSTQDLGLINTSGTAVPIAGFLFSLPAFSETDNCQGQVPASGSCTVHVTFAPLQLGPQNATLTVNFGNGALAQMIPLLGGVGVTPLSVTPGPLNFPDTLVGQTSTSQGVVIANNQGKAQAYTLTLAGDFVFTFSCSSFNPMPPQSGCVTQIVFQPKSPGQQQGSLTVTYPGTSVQSVVTLNGNGIGGAPVVSLPATQDFGSPAVGSTVQNSVSLKNTGNLPLTVSSMSVSGTNAADFNVPAGQCSTVAAGASCPIQVTFTPSVPLSRQATLTLNDNGLNSPQSMTLTGTGVGPFVTLLPSTFFVGQTLPGIPTNNQLLIGNGGNADLVISSLTFTGPNASEFSADIQLCGVVHGASTCLIKLILNPISGGPKAATLNINDNELGSPQTVPLTGTGIGPAINIPASVDFGLQPVGSTNQRVMNISNPGDEDLIISSALISGANASDFKLANQCPLVSPGGICGLQINFTPGAAGPRSATLTFSDNAFGSPHAVALTAGTSTPLLFVPVTPCRIADTRNPNGPFGGPFLGGQTVRGFTIPNSACNIPATAQAYSLNVTVVPHGSLGFLTTFPCGSTQPVVSTLNSDGRVKAVATIVPAGTNGAVCFFVTNDTDLVLDINGYFASASTPGALAFYPVTPCRLVDTRTATAPLGGPSLVATVPRTFPILSSPCNLPGSAQAYSMNFTSVPKGGLGFLSVWPAGQTQPLVSTLNAPTGAVTANAGIVPAGANGAVSVYATNDSDLVIDVNGYFAPPDVGGLSLFNVAPCRVLDSRNPSGTPPFSGQKDVNVVNSGCGAPASAQSYVLNATVVPPGGLGFLTLWPQGGTQPTVSTLNAGDGAVTSNMALVPTSNGSVSTFASNPSHLVLDISGYFAVATSAPTSSAAAKVATTGRDDFSVAPNLISNSVLENKASQTENATAPGISATPSLRSIASPSAKIETDDLRAAVVNGLFAGAKAIGEGVRHAPPE